MTSMQPAMAIALLILLPTIGAVLLAQIMRRTPMPTLAGAILGGALAGILLGAGVLGHAAPDFYRSVFLNAVTERAELTELRSAHEREMLVMIESDVSDVAIDELREHHLRAIAEAESNVAQAEQTRRDAATIAISAAFGLLLLTGAARRARASRRRIEPPFGPLAAAIGSLAIAGIPAALLIRWTLSESWPVACAFGLACAIGGAFPTRAAREAPAGRRSAVDLAALCAMALGLLALAYFDVMLGAGAIIATAAGVLLGKLLAPNRSLRRIVFALNMWLCVPALAAFALVYVDLASLASTKAFWIPVVVAVIFASDGRWLGGWLGWWTCGSATGKAEAWRRSSAMLSCEAGPIAIGCAALLGAIGMLSEVLVAAAVIGSIGVELSSGVRARFARSLDAGDPFLLDEPED